MTKTTKATKAPATPRAKSTDGKAAASVKSVRNSPAEMAPATKRPTKIDDVVALLRREEGAAIEELMAATGWQAHSVRGAISGALKKKLGLTVTSEKADGLRRYRVVEAQA